MLAGDVRSAEESFAAFYGVWQRWGVLPERYYYEGGGSLHPTEDYYPLRPELLESAFYLHQVRLHLAWSKVHSICTSCMPCMLVPLHDYSSHRVSLLLEVVIFRSDNWHSWCLAVDWLP